MLRLQVAATQWVGFLLWVSTLVSLVHFLEFNCRLNHPTSLKSGSYLRALRKPRSRSMVSVTYQSALVPEKTTCRSLRQ
jgi:hypothetical protein